MKFVHTRKKAIILASLELFGEKGYINTCIKEIASMLLQDTQEKIMTLLSEKSGFKEKL